jgi:hypothetical protein
MTVGEEELASTVQAMRPTVPARNFGISQRFYIDLGFHSELLTDGLVEMRLGACTFILQDYYVQQWADNLVIHLTVSDLGLWWIALLGSILHLVTELRPGHHSGRPGDWLPGSSTRLACYGELRRPLSPLRAPTRRVSNPTPICLETRWARGRHFNSKRERAQQR